MRRDCDTDSVLEVGISSPKMDHEDSVLFVL